MDSAQSSRRNAEQKPPNQNDPEAMQAEVSRLVNKIRNLLDADWHLPDKYLLDIRHRFVLSARQSKGAVASTSLTPTYSTSSVSSLGFQYNPRYVLPAPDSDDDQERQRLCNLLEDKRFLRNLRKLNELRALAQKPNCQNQHNVYDNICYCKCCLSYCCKNM